MSEKLAEPETQITMSVQALDAWMQEVGSRMIESEKDPLLAAYVQWKESIRVVKPSVASHEILERLEKLEKRRINRAGCERATVEQVIDYCISKQLTADDGVDFWERMENQEWKVKNVPVRDWKKVINTWKRSGYHPSQKQNGFQRVSQPSAAALHVTSQKELERVMEGIRRIKAGYDPHQDMSKEDRDKILPLIQRRNQLRQQLGITI